MTAEPESSRALPDLILDIDSADDEHVLFSNSESPTWSAKPNSKNTQDTQSSTSQPTNKPLSNNNNNKHQISEESKYVKSDSKATPRRAQFGANKQKITEGQSTSRPCEQHTFLTDITEVRQMEQGLLKLLDDFHSGNCRHLHHYGSGRPRATVDQEDILIVRSAVTALDSSLSTIRRTARTRVSTMNIPING
ncbi:uncharacterized protein TNCV_3440831 [Trichonephila clavipes]|uniref:Uncharacterized protein n=1 Tax=Trichonephila clavipes TaxID=2585209 RepID=A0A8X6W6F4_TRICX|nr:uncharacterized protein TNCV_3440831 [Trichonephila clavipes]